MKKILIIKLGYSETLDSEIGNTCSLGDVLRTTGILHIYKNDYVVWLTDKAARDLLKGNPYINEIIYFDVLTVTRLENERFDILINLEKAPGLCALADKISASYKYGFGFDPQMGRARAYDYAQDALSIASQEDEKKRNNKCWQEILFGILNTKWEKKGYILGYKPETKQEFDIGFNMFVGPKFPVKEWAMKNWEILQKNLKGYKITRQKGLNDIKEYIDWINSCRLLITNDSLGLHIAIALNKKIIALVGPTSKTEIPNLDNITIISTPKKLKCIPCFKPDCAINDPCVNYITPESVACKVREILKK